MNLQQFLADEQGKTYTDVVKDKRFDLDLIFRFLSDPKRVNRMLMAQEHFLLPPLGGVAVEMETHYAFQTLMEAPKQTTRRLRQAIGVAVRIIMEQNGWKKTGIKGSMYSISHIFRAAEMYQPPK
jgi:hypothetical protein